MRGYGYVAGINILGDCLPHEDNRITLSDELDARGLPKPHVVFDAGENEQRMTAHADRIMRLIWDAAGARDVWSFDRHAHVIGTARMGATRRRLGRRRRRPRVGHARPHRLGQLDVPVVAPGQPRPHDRRQRPPHRGRVPREQLKGDLIGL